MPGFDYEKLQEGVLNLDRLYNNKEQQWWRVVDIPPELSTILWLAAKRYWENQVRSGLGTEPTAQSFPPLIESIRPVYGSEVTTVPEWLKQPKPHQPGGGLYDPRVE